MALTATVRHLRPLTPGVARVTFTVPGFPATGVPDEWFGIFFGAVGDHRLRRVYTVRAHRPEAEEVDVDFILHGGGPGMDWLHAARPGDTLAWWERIGSSFTPPEGTTELLLAADLTGLPALGRIVESLPAGTRATVLADVRDLADRQRWESEADVEVSWIDGDLGEAVRASEATGYVWMAGENAAVRATRRHLRHELGLPGERYSLIGYWRPRAEEWNQRYETHAAELTALWQRFEREGRDPEELEDAYEAALERVGL